MTSAPVGGDDRFAVVVTSHSFDREPLLLRCIQALSDSRVPPDELVISVDRNEALAAHLRRTLGERITVVVSEGEGVAPARNRGLGATSAPLVGFVDDDVTPDTSWTKAVRDAFSSRPEAVCVASKILADYADAARAVPAPLLWLVGCTYEGHRVEAGTVSRPIGSAMAFRRHAIESVGGFPAEFGPAHARRRSSNEELALSEVLRRRFGSGCIWYEPTAVARHAVPATRTTVRYLLERCWVEGTSKADIVWRFGRASMADDRRYVGSTLVPRLLRSLKTAKGLREASRLGVALVVTGAGFASRRATRLLSSRRPSRPGGQPGGQSSRRSSDAR